MREADRGRQGKEGRPTKPPFGGVGLFELEDNPIQIAFAAYHYDCAPEPNQNPYWIAVERARTLEQWCGWVHHLTEKSWMSKDDIARTLTFWFHNRGQNAFELAG